MTQIRKHQLANNTLTGASFHRGFKFYDETETLSAGEIRYWNGVYYKALNNITGVEEGNLTQSPDISLDWTIAQPYIYSVYPTITQAFTNNRITIHFNAIRHDNPNNFTLNNGEITFLNSTIYMIAVIVTAKDNANTRSGANAFVQVDSGSGFSDLPFIKISTYHRNADVGEDNGSVIFPLKVNAGDKLRVQIMRYSGTGVLSTVPDGCMLSVFSLDSGVGPKGEKGDPGPSGDITWTGSFNSSISYAPNMAVSHGGSSYVCVSNNPSPSVAPPDNTYWDVLAEKGIDGSGALISLTNNGVTVPNTPHSILNFTGDISVTDVGGGTADIDVSIPKNSYMVPIWAEENGPLSNNAYEYSFGNGGVKQGIVIYVPNGYKCEIVAMTLRLNGGTATVETYINNASTNATVTVSSGNSATNDSFTPVVVNNGDHLRFRTLSANGTSQSNVVSAWLKYTEL